MSREHQASDHQPGPEPLYPTPLTPELAEFFRDQRIACVAHASDLGTVLVAKAPGHEIRSIQGQVPVDFRYELYHHPLAPVIRMVLTIHDQPSSPLALETFINVEDPQQRSDFAALAKQRELDVLFYDEALRHQLTKRVRNVDLTGVPEVISRADQILAAITTERFDFDQAKAAVMRTTSL